MLQGPQEACWRGCQVAEGGTGGLRPVVDAVRLLNRQQEALFLEAFRVVKEPQKALTVVLPTVAWFQRPARGPEGELADSCMVSEACQRARR